MSKKTRKATAEYKSKETEVKVEINLDGKGKVAADTSVGFLDHMLDHLGKHSLMDITITARGDLEVDAHHTVEDVAICLGQALSKALGSKAGIMRFGWAIVPMEDALAQVAIDLSGRAAVAFNVPFIGEKIGSFDTQLIEEFLRRFALSAQMNLHVNVPYGSNDHHIAEAIFKALALALRTAKSYDPQRANQIPSTKGKLQ